MKKTVFLILALIMTLSFVGCGREENTTPTDTKPSTVDTTPKADEVSLKGTVIKAEGNSVLFEDEKGSQYAFSYSEEIELIENGERVYILDSWQDYLSGKTVTLIASAQMRETYPMGIDVRMIIFE